jgi:outer membrane murein-binding lipoprotein Lpp
MEKVIKSLPAVLFSAYFVKVAAMGAGYVDALVLAVAGALYIAIEFKTSDKKVMILEEQVSDLAAQNEQLKKEMGELRSYVTGAKLGQVRMQQNAR